MPVLTESEINEFAAKILDPKDGAPGIIDPNTAYDWCKNAEIVIEENAVEMGEDSSPDALRKYVKKEMKNKILDLKRFSPSEMAIFWVNEKEKVHPSQISTQDIFAQKFGLSSPSHIEGGLKRSIFFGNEVKNQFIRAFKNQGFQKTEKSKMNMKALSGKLISVYNNPIPALPWLKPGKVDFLENINGETWAVFFKMPPNEDSVRQITKEVPEHYYVEMAQTLIAMDEVGIKVDNVILAPFNTSDMKFGYFDNKNENKPLFRSSIKEISISSKMKNRIKEIGNKMYYDYLEKVSIPPWNISTDYTHIDPSSIRGSVVNAFGRYTMLNTLKNKAGKEAEELKKSILRFLPTEFAVDKDYRGKVSAGGYVNCSISEKETVNIDEAANYLINEKGISRDNLRSDTFDSKKIIETFKTLGLEEEFNEQFVVKKESITVTVPNRSPFKALAEDIYSEIVPEMDGVFQQLSGIDISDQSDNIAKAEALNVEKENNKLEQKEKAKEQEKDIMSNFDM